MSELRLYSFVNFYLSSIQQGIQTHHAAQELVNKYVYGVENTSSYVLRNWSLYHKTDIILNGGDMPKMLSIWDFLRSTPLYLKFDNLRTKHDGESESIPLDVVLPFASFEEEGLGGIMTAIVIILPDSLFNAVNYRTAINSFATPAESAKFCEKFDRSCANAWFWQSPDGEWTMYPENSDEGLFITLLKSCPLAR